MNFFSLSLFRVSVWTHGFLFIQFVIISYSFWCSHSLQWRVRASLSWQPFISFFLYFLQMPNDLGLPTLSLAPDLEPVISPRSPGSFWQRKVFRKQDLSIRGAHCYWDVILVDIIRMSLVYFFLIMFIYAHILFKSWLHVDMYANLTEHF